MLVFNKIILGNHWTIHINGRTTSWNLAFWCKLVTNSIDQPDYSLRQLGYSLKIKRRLRTRAPRETREIHTITYALNKQFVEMKTIMIMTSLLCCP